MERGSKVLINCILSRLLSFFVFSSIVLFNDTWHLVAKVDFNREIRPILSQNCISCHGLDHPKSELRLDFADFAYQGGKSGLPAVVPGKPEKSELLVRVRSKGIGRMPKKGKALSPDEISLLEQWIREGASYAKHWAYIPPSRPAVPAFDSDDFIANPIDAFVLRELGQREWEPSVPVSPEIWLRRVSLGLTGLPPTLEQIDDFLAKDSPEVREQVVDRLLNSPRYGEHWARQWLDLARYADSNGFQADQLRDSWAYRDWVIEAMNMDLPFDRFTIEQLAGDLLPEPSLDQRIATGFHRTSTCNVEAGVHPEENRVNQVFDRVNTTGLTWLGATLECAQCHSHKYDPISQEEYYQFFAFFNNTPLEVENKSGAGVSFDFWGPKMELPTSVEEQAKRSALKSEMDQIKRELKVEEKRSEEQFAAWKTRQADLLKQANKLDSTWETLIPLSAKSDGGEEFEFLNDHSLLAGGKSGNFSTYFIRLQAQAGNWNSVQLETLLHDSLPSQGPGRNYSNPNPNFVLSELNLYLEEGNRSLAFARAQADFSQSGFKPEHLFDGEISKRNGWAISPEFGKPHWVRLELAKSLILKEPTVLCIEMRHRYGGGRNVGRPRFSLSERPLPRTSTLDSRLAVLLAKPNRSAKEKKELRDHFEKTYPKILTLRKDLKRMETDYLKSAPPTTLVMVEMEEGRETRLMSRGNYLSPKEKVLPGVPKVLHGWRESWPDNRLGLARWLVDPENPLVARVTVNRWWGQLFGTGIVSTEADFGAQGELPTHPDLLDWLAVEFMEGGWSMKRIHKLIVLSSTYAQSSSVTAEMLEVDPSNRFFQRGPRLRMSAEMIRDNALRISGLLSKRMAGPPVYPPQPDGLWRQTGRNEPKYRAAANEDRFRRGIYVIWRRAAPYASFVNFDGPDRSSCLPKRSRTNTPLQALTLLNDQAYVEMALGFAREIVSLSPRYSMEDKARIAFRRALTRAPSERELSILLSLQAKELKRLRSEPKRVEELLKACPVIEIDADVDRLELASWFFVANALLNLDETITQG